MLSGMLLKEAISLPIHHHSIVVELEDTSTAGCMVVPGRILMRGTSTSVDVEKLKVIIWIIRLNVRSWLELGKQSFLVDLFHPLLFDLKLFLEDLIQIVVLLLLYMLWMRSPVNFLGFINHPDGSSSSVPGILSSPLRRLLHVLYRDFLARHVL